MEGRTVGGLRIFLLSLLRMCTEGRSETCSNVQEYIRDGVATKLFKKYGDYFEKNGFHPDHIESIDAYYRQFVGCVDGKEEGKYACRESDGFHLLIALALNEIF